MKVILGTIFALVAFAGNSVLCRLALGNEAIDAASFTAIRLISGIVILVLILSLSGKKETTASKGSWKASLYLFLYAVTFSYAYITLDTGTGALVLFGSVQITMMVISYISGDRFHAIEWFGLIFAFSGFVYLTAPNVSTPSVVGFILMLVSGVSWGAYTIAGKGSKNPLSDTAYNFIRTLPFAIVLIVVAMVLGANKFSVKGVLLAVLSGGVASGIGYAFWYLALSGLSAMKAAILQLLVPVLAAMGGVMFVDELVTPRLVYSSLMILGGIFVVIVGKYSLTHFQSKTNF